jgi:hypothetical protein
MMISGTTMGATMTASIRRWPKNLVRHRPRAATVPRTVASSVATEAMNTLFHTAGSQNCEEKNSWYQRRLSPGSG